MKFQVGDVVRCLNASEHLGHCKAAKLKMGRVYTVTDVDYGGEQIKLAGDKTVSWGVFRFEKVVRRRVEV